MARPIKAPRTERGRAIYAHIADMGLSLTDAAKKAGVSFNTLRKACWGDPENTPLGTIEKLCESLGLPLAVLSPRLATLHASERKSA